MKVLQSKSMLKKIGLEIEDEKIKLEIKRRDLVSDLKLYQVC